MERTSKKSKSKIPYHEIFIEQAPTAIAMLDKNMCFIAASNRWVEEYKLQGINISGKSYYDLFFEISDDVKELHQQCLDQAISIQDEAPFKRKDGTVQWLYWDISPWYIAKNKVGGLFIHTIDITPHKENELKKARTKDIFLKTKEVAKIGTWESNIALDKVYWSKMVRKIHDLPEDFQPSFENTIHFYTKESQEKINKLIPTVTEKGESFDIELELVTAKDNHKWIRLIGKTEEVDGIPSRIFGIVQDITEIKQNKLELNKAQAELNAIFNSEALSIFSTDANGMIKHFNKGAEKFLGYAAEEVIGKMKPSGFHPEKEVKKFKADLAAKYGKNPVGFNHYKDLRNENVNDTRQWTYINKDGTSLPAQATVSSVKDNQGKNIGFIALATDISEIKNYQNELLAKNQLLNFAEQMTLMGHWRRNFITNKGYWSKSLHRIFESEKDSSNFNQEKFESLIHPDDRQIISDHIQETLQTKLFKSFSHRIITPSGKLKTIHVMGKVITNDKDEIVEIIGTTQDVTELRMAEKKFKGLLESAPDAMIIIDERGSIQLVNKQTESLFQYSANELVHASVEPLIPCITASVKAAKFSINNNTRQVGIIEELFAIQKMGKKIPIQINMAPLQWEEGILVSLAIRDITKQKAAERKLIKAKENLEGFAKKLTEQNKQLADFTHITSHNLRSPVSNLNSLLDIYRTTDDETLRASLFEKFETVINHLTLTLNTLVEALKTKSLYSDEDIQEVEFEKVLNKTKEVLAGEILKTGAIIKADFSKCPGIEYHKIYMDSIFLNLLSNAIKYRSKDRKPEIEIETIIEDGKIMLDFRDNGLGIDLEQHGHKLFGLNKVFHRHPDAKGVGLFLTKSQIEALGGTIYATSKVNEGTTFTINFN
ncbi:PAS domain S-box protein [Zobellia alginiliquefaciens]|uniref:PAS domain S-box protein n=1 Tax=Zobellia alginiliquefaciens TaxID=3032586 RepID=UPI0023E38614|nr:PAS domain S-box protein [Zobellia alginiliquefaciens]